MRTPLRYYIVKDAEQPVVRTVPVAIAPAAPVAAAPGPRRPVGRLLRAARARAR